MIHDSNALATALGASLEYECGNDQLYDVEIYRFSDDRLRYELHVLPHNGTAQLAFDPKAPIQPCPMLEFSFPCTEIVVGHSAYDENEIAVRFFDSTANPDGQRLTMTWVPEGYWYLWANAIGTLQNNVPSDAS